MNEQKAPAGIEWCRVILPDGTRTRGYTHNPIKGCKHECRWTMPDSTVTVCYAEDVAEGVARAVYPEGFAHHYWTPGILEEPLRVKHRAGIFWGSMSDVFGAWVPKEQTQACLDVMRRADWHYHMTLTKNAPNLLNYEFADNVWVGASSPPDFMMGNPLSVNAKERMLAKTLRVFKQLKAENRAKVTWLSIEPLSWDITDILVQHEGALDWAVIGAASNGNKKYAVDHDILMRVLAELDRQNIPVFFKGNLKTDPYAAENWREDFPTYRVAHPPVPTGGGNGDPTPPQPAPPTGPAPVGANHAHTAPTLLTKFQSVAHHYDPDAQTWDDPRYVYIGRYMPSHRLKQSVWQNPFKLTEDTPDARRAAIREYRAYIEGRMKDDPDLFDLETLRGKVLVCWCSEDGSTGRNDERLCHGHVLLDLLAERATPPPSVAPEVTTSEPFRQAGADDVSRHAASTAALDELMHKRAVLLRTLETQSPYAVYSEFARDLFGRNLKALRDIDRGLTAGGVDVEQLDPVPGMPTFDAGAAWRWLAHVDAQAQMEMDELYGTREAKEVTV